MSDLMCPICGVDFKDWSRHVCYSKRLDKIDADHVRAEAEDELDCEIREDLSLSERLQEGFAAIDDD